MFLEIIASVRVRPARGLIAVLLLAACQPPAPLPPEPAAFSGSDSCQSCHQAEHAAWQSSHHALAMQVATPDTVLGDFVAAATGGATGPFQLVTGESGYSFVARDADGEIGEFAIPYTFGVFPLQQYLVDYRGGRLQALPMAWDARPAASGGQRWFDLYPGETFAPGDPLHWTGREQNWNFMCAECHSTGLDKQYDLDNDTFRTTWAEISIGCEGCHGPASRHVAAMRDGGTRGSEGLQLDLDDAGRAAWIMNPETGIAARSEPRLRPPVQPEACGRCHARRSVASPVYEFGRPLLDTHVPALLDAGLYFADGQIDDEVYVYGSFLQSRMYRAGVSCSDCHEPHAAKLKTSGSPSDVCATCHLPTRFDDTTHHRHVKGSVACVDCHMPVRTYMQIDDRRDHSFRVPRPDLSLATGAPNACNACHADRDAAWATKALQDWYGEPTSDHFGLALHAGRAGHVDANRQLVAAAANESYPGIARATALTLLRPPYSAPIAEAIRDGLGSAEALIRIAALRALEGLQPELQAEWAGPLLSDRVRGVRIEAARVAGPLRAVLHLRFEPALDAAEQELALSYLVVAERPEARAGLAGMYLTKGDAAAAEAAYRQALALEPGFVEARVNLADLYRQLGRESDAQETLQQGIGADPGQAAYHHALGLLLVRTNRPDDGLRALAEAVRLAAGNARYRYVHAVALNSLGNGDAAIAALRDAAAAFPADFDVHWGLATMLRDQGRADEARDVAIRLAERYPGVPPLEQLIASLD